MENNSSSDKVVGDLVKDFKLVGKHHVHGWYAWAILGLVSGMALMLVTVANQHAQFVRSSAQMIIPVQDPANFPPVPEPRPKEPSDVKYGPNLAVALPGEKRIKMSATITASDPMDFVQQFAKANALKNVVIETGSLRNLSTGRFMAFVKPQKITISGSASMTTLNSQLKALVNSTKFFEVTLNDGLTNWQAIGFLPPRIETYQSSFFDTSSTLGTITSLSPNKCRCDATITGKISCPVKTTDGQDSTAWVKGAGPTGGAQLVASPSGGTTFSGTAYGKKEISCTEGSAEKDCAAKCTELAIADMVDNATADMNNETAGQVAGKCSASGTKEKDGAKNATCNKDQPMKK
jgi:hypothetical protein